MEQNQNNNKNKNQKNDKRGWILVIATTLITGFIFLSFFNMVDSAKTEEITYSEFIAMVENGKVEKVEIGSDRLMITPKVETSQNGWAQFFPSTQITYYTGLGEGELLEQRLDEAGVNYTYKLPNTGAALFWNIMLTILPFVLLFVFFSFMMKRMSKGGGIMGIGKSNAKMYVEKQTPKTGWFNSLFHAFIVGGMMCCLGQMFGDIIKSYNL